MKAYITVMRDPSVGIRDIHFDMELYDLLDDYDSDERLAFKTSLTDWAKEQFGGWRYGYVILGDECPDCGNIFLKDNKCHNINCVSNIPPDAGEGM